MFFKSKNTTLTNSHHSSNNNASVKPIPIWLKKLPNRLSFLRILCIPFIVYFMIQGCLVPETIQFWNVIPIEPSSSDKIAAILFVVAALTDFFDGWLARKFKIESMLGKLLDPLADKLLVVAALIILVEKHRMEGWIAVIIIVRDLAINVIRLSANEDGIQIASNFIGKTKTTLLDIGIIGLTLYGFIAFIPFHILGHIFIWLALLASIISAAQYLFAYAKALKKQGTT